MTTPTHEAAKVREAAEAAWEKVRQCLQEAMRGIHDGKTTEAGLIAEAFAPLVSRLTSERDAAVSRAVEAEADGARAGT